MIKVFSKERKGNDLEISTQGDGNTVDIQESQTKYVKASIDPVSGIKGAGDEVLINALDYTSKGDEDAIEVMLPGNRKVSVKKKFITGVKLNEYGVYNSETDIDNNVKTKDNVPSLEHKVVNKVIEKVREVIGSLSEIKQSVESETSISYDPIDIALHELGTYIASLETEVESLSKTKID